MDRDMRLAPILFGASVLVGMLFIVTAKLAMLPAWAVTLVPILVMCGYAAMTMMPRLRLRDDQTGDNLYYMGFLFTLASLGVSLYNSPLTARPSRSSSRSASPSARRSRACIAVFFSQMRRDPVEIEREARIELAEAARRVRNELDATVMEMSNFQRATLQVINDGFVAVQANVDRISEELASAMRKTVEATRAPLWRRPMPRLRPSRPWANRRLLASMRMAVLIAGRLDESGRKLAEENDRIASSSGR